PAHKTLPGPSGFLHRATDANSWPNGGIRIDVQHHRNAFCVAANVDSQATSSSSRVPRTARRRYHAVAQRGFPLGGVGEWRIGELGALDIPLGCIGIQPEPVPKKSLAD